MVEFEFIGANDFDIAITGFSVDEVSKIFDETKGIKISDKLDDVALDAITVKFSNELKTEIINAICDVCADFNGVQVWCGDEQI